MCCNFLCKWHGSPLNMAFHFLAFVVLVYGLWMHSWSVILSAVVVALIGHLSQIIGNMGNKAKIKPKRK